MPPPSSAPPSLPWAEPARQGLSEAQARERLAQFGPNVLEDRERQGLLQTLGRVATEPMFLLLLLAAAVYLLLGDLGEGLLLSFFALLTVGLVVLQERRSAHALDALRSLAVPQVRLLREGRWQRRSAGELVPGDLMAVGEGERVAADGRLLEATGLAADESLLTGESVPVRKRAWLASDARDGAVPPGGDDSPWLHAGTLVVAGHGLLEVAATGRCTQLGRIGASLARIDSGDTPLQGQLRRVVQVFGAAALGTSLLLLLWHGWREGDWLRGLLSGIAIGMALLPEEFPMALTVFLALGAWRLARIQVLARRPAVIEALGSATLLCVDKTGTLTENRMSLRRLCSPGLDLRLQAPPEETSELPEAVHRLLEFSVLASRRGGADPMDRAVLQRGDAGLAGSEHLHPDWTLLHEYPLSPALLAFSQVWTAPDGRRWIAAKGAPEAVADLCHLDEAQWADLRGQVQALAAEGLRVLAVAAGPVETGGTGELPPLAHDHRFEWQGLLGFEDPLRASVPAAVAQACEAGVGVAMITGDHAATALAIARQAGIEVQAGVLTGEQIAALDDAALEQALRRVRVFARVMPEQKLRLVQAFQRLGETVAMTGDGVNDAPALKAAHVGIAMGVRGTDVAREAAGLVLLDEDFGRIVGGIRMGRRIFDNLRRVMAYIVAIHVPLAGLALLPVLLGLPPLLLPAHVVLTEMVIDPICSLAFEGAPEHPRLMRRPPRRREAGLLEPRLLLMALAQGTVLLAAALGLYAWALDAGRAVEQARTLALFTLTLGNLGLVGLDLSLGLGWRSLLGPAARAYRAVCAAALLVLLTALWLPGLRQLLHLALLPWSDVLRMLAVLAAGGLLAALLTGRLQARD